MPSTSSLAHFVPAVLLLAALMCACTLGGHAYVGGDVQRRSAVEARPGAASLTIARRSAAEAPQAGPANALPPPLAAGATPPNPETSPEQINALRPFDGGSIEPMRPFVLKTDAPDRARAVQCLAQAVYYEAAREPLKGQQAVAQVVLNRVRHPAYPKSVCGVVYQGAARATGCQFTFTCDGSMRWPPQSGLWAQAVAVARRALDGYVDKDVGSATSYHAVYVAPYWAPTLVKMTQVGAHIFYRWTGAWGEPAAFVGRYAGREMLSPAVLNGGDPTSQSAPPATHKVTFVNAGVAETYAVADAPASASLRERGAGVLQPVVRQPTPDEVRQINQHLAGVEKALDAAPAAADAAMPAQAIAPVVGTAASPPVAATAPVAGTAGPGPVPAG